MKSFSLVLLLLFSTHLYSQDFSGLNTASQNTVEGYIQSEMANENMIGVSVGIIKNGEIVFLKGFGLANRELGINADVNTMYRIASISKTFTAIAALQLWEDSLLSLTSNIQNYVPEYPNKPQGVITAEDLLSNESGIQHYSQNTSYNTDSRNHYIIEHPYDYDPIAAIDIFKDQSILFTPGSAYNYSTFGFNLLAAVVERAGSAPFEDQVKTRIVQTADMPFFQPAYRGKMPFYKQATGYDEENNAIIVDKGGNSDYDDVTFKLGGGGWMATVRDLTHFMKAFIHGDLLESGTATTMGTNHDPTNGTNYGYGIQTAIRNGDTLLFHSGSQTWTKSMIYFSPENHNGVAILTNSRHANIFPLARLIYDNLPNLTATGSSYSNPIPTSLAISSLLSPANNATVLNPTTQLSWTTIDYTDKYEFEYANNSAFTNSIVAQTTDTSVFLNGLAQNQTYFWRVRALNDYIYGGISGSWSNTYQFSTDNLTGISTLPFREDFENYHGLQYWSKDNIYSGNGYKWSFQHDNEVGRAKFGIWSITSITGDGALTLDALSSGGDSICTNYATLTLDLESYVNSTDLTLGFDFMHHGEESHPEDKVWIRGNDTEAWLEIYDWFLNNGGSGVTEQVVNLDIDSLLSVNGQQPSATFQLRFGQRDNSYASDSSANDGLTIDNIIIDGTVITANARSIPTPGISIYPNPTSGRFEIIGLNEGKVKIMDITGNILLEKLSAGSPIDLSHLPNGLYIMVAETDDQTIMKKVLKY